MRSEIWSTGVMEWWSIAKYQIPSTKSQGVRYQVSGVGCQEKETGELKPEH
jgi:hypothetical protein